MPTYAEYKTLLRAVQNKKSGRRERALPIISEQRMAIAEREFWRKRGFTSPRGTTSAGVIY